MLVVVTGPVRSGKSVVGLSLASATGLPVTMVVGGAPDDEEMRRRIERHQGDRTASVRVVQAAPGSRWFEDLPQTGCVLVDCLGTVLGSSLIGLVPDGADVASETAERVAGERASAVCEALLRRSAPTVVVTNEVGWGVVPATPLGRLFADTLGRANRQLVDAARAAWLVVGGRCIELTSLPREVAWPE